MKNKTIFILISLCLCGCGNNEKNLILPIMVDNCVKAYLSMGDFGKELQRNGVSLHDCCQHKMQERLSVMTNKEIQNAANEIKTKGYEELDITVVPSKYTQQLCQEEMIWQYMLGYPVSDKPVRIK